MLRQLQNEEVFSNVFSHSLSQCTVPTCLKTSTVVPVPKQTVITSPNEYRPLALTPVLVKSRNTSRLLRTPTNTEQTGQWTTPPPLSSTLYCATWNSKGHMQGCCSWTTALHSTPSDLADCFPICPTCVYNTASAFGLRISWQTDHSQSGWARVSPILWHSAQGPHKAVCWPVCQSVLGQDTEPQTAPDVLVSSLHGSHRHQCINVCITVSLFGLKYLINALNVNIWLISSSKFVTVSNLKLHYNFVITTL